ncbi:ATP-dependent Clp protease ATP-binding subunit ClpA [Planotetraspora sp. GP83]
MFERFTDRARRVVVLAQEEARSLNHTYIGTEHILLGLVHEGDGAAAKVLRDEGIDLEAVRQDVERMIGIGAETPGGHIPFTPRAKKVLELSLREALHLNHNYIGTEHILLGLIREGEGVGAQVLAGRGVHFDHIRMKVIQEARLESEASGRAAGLFIGGPSIVARLDRLQESLDRVERRLDAMNAPPDPGPAAPTPG